MRIGGLFGGRGGGLARSFGNPPHHFGVPLLAPALGRYPHLVQAPGNGPEPEPVGLHLPTAVLEEKNQGRYLGD